MLVAAIIKCIPIISLRDQKERARQGRVQYSDLIGWKPVAKTTSVSCQESKGNNWW